MDIDSYSICSPVKGITKQYAIWGNKGSSTFPLVYLQRPKHISDNDWQLVINHLSLDIPKAMIEAAKEV